MSPELQPQDIERVMRPHGDLLPMPRCTDRQQPSNYAHIGYVDTAGAFLFSRSEFAMQMRYDIKIVAESNLCCAASSEPKTSSEASPFRTSLATLATCRHTWGPWAPLLQTFPGEGFHSHAMQAPSRPLHGLCICYLPYICSTRHRYFVHTLRTDSCRWNHKHVDMTCDGGGLDCLRSHVSVRSLEHILRFGKGMHGEEGRSDCLTYLHAGME